MNAREEDLKRKFLIMEQKLQGREFQSLSTKRAQRRAPYQPNQNQTNEKDKRHE